MNEARYWHPLSDGRVQCDLCPHACTLREGHTGLCRVRTMSNGKLVAAAFGLVSSVHVDPIEKKPLYHFYPGSRIFSVGGWGCNFRCVFCQNWTISQQVLEGASRLSPCELVIQARAHGCESVAYTYNEPLVAWEWVHESAREARAAGIANVLVTNGYVCGGPAAELLPLIDAVNVDIKSFSDAFYRQHCNGSLRPVLDFAVLAKQTGCHVEVTNLVIPGLNDQPEDMESLARWVAEHLGEDTPFHLSAYYPQYKLDVPPTPPEILERAHERCRGQLNHVYLGNVRSHTGQNTVCPQCGAVWVERRGYGASVTGLEEGCCRSCGRESGLIGT